MVKYILSDGLVTTDKDEAVIDALMIQLQIETKVNPWYEGGFDKIIHEITETRIRQELVNRVNSVITKINNKFNVDLILGELNVLSDESYSLTIRYNGNERKINSRYQIGT
jgi:hypothetical protein